MPAVILGDKLQRRTHRFFSISGRTIASTHFTYPRIGGQAE